MKFLEDIINKPSVMQRIIGVTSNQLELLEARAFPHWQESEDKRKNRYARKRKIGAGRPYKFKTLKEKIVIVLLFYKHYWTQEALGLTIGLDQSNVSRLLAKTLPLMEKAADPELAEYLDKLAKEYEAAQKTNSLAAFYTKYEQVINEAAHDVTEGQIQRPSDEEEQEKHYSGKKKKHTIKIQISVSSYAFILNVSKGYPGSIHDKKIMDIEKTISKIPDKICQRLDSGYQGVKQLNPTKYIVLPFKKPKGKELSKLQKELNKAHSKRRVIVENVISRIKKFRILVGVYRGSRESYNQIFRNVAALINFKLKANTGTAGPNRFSG